MSENRKYPVNALLRTKDGRQIGNAIVVGHRAVQKYSFCGEQMWVNEIVTDYGNEARLTDKEIDAWFYEPTVLSTGRKGIRPHKYAVNSKS
jgi:hypothetical protein